MNARVRLVLAPALGALLYTIGAAACSDWCGEPTPIGLGLYEPRSLHDTNGDPAQLPDAEVDIREDEVVINYVADDGFTYRVTYDVWRRTKISDRD